MTQKYKSDIIIGQRYIDPLTGMQGMAVGVTFHLHGCERVLLEYYMEESGTLKIYDIDAPRLVLLDEKTGQPVGEAARLRDTGGPTTDRSPAGDR